MQWIPWGGRDGEVRDTTLSTPCNGFREELEEILGLMNLSTPCNGFTASEIASMLGKIGKLLSTPCNEFRLC